MFRNPCRTGARLLLVAATATASAAVAAEPTPAELQAQLEQVIRINQEMRREMDTLREEVSDARDEAIAAQDMAAAAERAKLPPVSQYREDDDALLSIPAGPVNLQLLNISLDTLFSAGWSSAKDEDLKILQGGDHDPRRRGFNLQQVELGFQGAVDPYFTADAYLVYFLDPEGESRFELEEAFATTMMLPFGLEEHGFQVEAGQFFTEYGRFNPRHPHTWDWQDQPIVNTRLFGGDGLRNPGVRIGWLTPLPWFSELHLGAQSSQGETAVSFLASDEVFDDRGIGGRPFDSGGVRHLEDLLYLMRWVNGFDVSETVSAQWGASALFGPNAAGDRTWIAGSDLVVKWNPLSSDRGWPFVEWTTEFSFRHYEADGFTGCPEGDECAPAEERSVGSGSIDDYGLVTQLLWGFRRNWSAGIRYEFVSGSDASVGFDEAADTFVRVSRSRDPFRDDRHRISPLLVFQPSEFSRIRLQYNYDNVGHLDERNIHTGWIGLEFFFGAHPAHAY